MWAMDICYLYTRKHDGFDRSLITILDDHSRTVIASGLSERQTVSEVVAVLKAAVLTYGVPQRLVCDRGSQFTCSEFRRVCAMILVFYHFEWHSVVDFGDAMVVCENQLSYRQIRPLTRCT